MHRPRRIRIVVTAGPTREPIDPVRYISNYSTGIFGYAIAGEAARRGCSVTLISGPVAVPPPAGVRVVPVETTHQMQRVVLRESACADYLIMAAAVCDWRPQRIATAKEKKAGRRTRTLRLVATDDILAAVARQAHHPVLIGCALETSDLVRRAHAKLRAKRLAMIIANKTSVRAPAFGTAAIPMVLMMRDGTIERVRAASKERRAYIILDKILSGALG